MAQVKRQKLRFTGKRTGKAQMAIPGLGIVTRGSIIEVDADVAEAWMAITNAAGESDFAPSGEEVRISADEAQAHDHQQQERASARAEAKAEVDGEEASAEK